MRYILAVFAFITGLSHASDKPTIDVHRDANCGCCSEWISHLKEHGFNVNDYVEDDMRAVKNRLGVPAHLASCHTGVIDGKFVEGHVPAGDILKLQQRADLAGAAVPGMPMGSPGMEMGEHKDAFQVIGLDRQGAEHILNQYPSH